MSFIGLVTRKEKDTGVNLMAKVVTPSKKKSAKKVFRVKVKANALDDFSCCVIDHATAVDKINKGQNMDELIDDIPLSYNGIHGTTITYRIIDLEAPLLSMYLGEDGKILGRPRHGEGDAIGYIEITVTKNAASVTSRIIAVVKSVSAEEVLNDINFTQAALWNLIKGQNDSYQQGNEWSGHNNIAYKLNLITTKNVDKLSKTPVSITWAVKDNTIDFATLNNIYTEPRLDIATGEISRCDYKAACKMVDNAIAGVDARVIGAPNNALQNRVRIGGLVLTAKLTLNSVTKEVVFNCATISKYLTNQEIMDVVMDNICIFKEDYSTIRYKETGDSSFETINAPVGGGTYTLKAFGNRGSETFQAPELKLGTGSIIGVSISNAVMDYNGSSPYPDSGLLQTAFGGGFQSDEGESYMKLVIDFDELKNADTERKKFSCTATISIAGYSANGINAGGSALMQKRYAQLVVNTSAMSGGGTSS